jgi:nitrite reductase (NO-forming)
MSQTMQRPPASTEEGGFHGAEQPPLKTQEKLPIVPQKKQVFPNWGITAIATIILVSFLIVGVVFSQQLGAKQSASSTVASTTSSSSTTETSNSSTTSSAPVAGPTMNHQLYNPQAPAALQGSTVNVTLTVKEVLLPIAPGVVYHAWTFNGTVPGPVIRVKQGQTIHFTLINDGNMPHSIDFHAAQTPWNVNYKEIPVGKSFSFDWKANYPGVFMYHCGAPVVIYHMANGMYGAIIVDPADGWSPAQEYVLVQSEFYTHRLSDGTYVIDPTKVNNGTPDYVVFNGYANQYKTDPITVKAGEPVRIFIVNAGPTEFSAFHVIGAIFSDSYADGNPANHEVGNQTVMIPPGGAVMVELTIPQAGLYPFVTHSFIDVGKGALGVLKVTQ